MLPEPDQLDRIAQLASGSLSDVPFPVLLVAHAVRGGSRALIVSRGEVTKRITLGDRGMPVDCSSNLLQDTLGAFLVQRGDLTAEERDRFLGEARAGGERLGEILIAAGVMTATVLDRTLQQQLAKKLLDCFTWHDGTFVVESLSGPVDRSTKVNTARLVVMGIAKLASTEEVDTALERLGGVRLAVHPNPTFPVTDVRVGEAGSELLAVLGKPAPVEALALTRDQKRLLYALAMVGIVVPEDRLPAAVQPTPGSLPTLTAPVAGPRPTGASDPQREAIVELYLKHTRLDPFDLLGIAEDAGTEAIESAFLAYASRTAPWQLVGTPLSDLVERSNELFLAGARAFAELADGERRNSLINRRRQALASATPNAATRNHFAIQSSLLDAQHQFTRGQQLRDEGRFEPALVQLQFAVDCDPQNPTYRAELAHCQFLSDPNRLGRQALLGLDEAMRMDSGCGLAAYYKGVILGRMGRIDEAETLLKRAFLLMKPNRRPIDALRELEARGRAKKRTILGALASR